MARTQYTFTFTNAQPGADVGFNFPAYADASTPDADGPAVVLDSTNSVSVWADSDYLIAHTVDGRGVQIVGVATHAADDRRRSGRVQPVRYRRFCADSGRPRGRSESRACDSGG